jgi:hypothetical protein
MLNDEVRSERAQFRAITLKVEIITGSSTFARLKMTPLQRVEKFAAQNRFLQWQRAKLSATLGAAIWTLNYPRGSGDFLIKSFCVVCEREEHLIASLTRAYCN